MMAHASATQVGRAGAGLAEPHLGRFGWAEKLGLAGGKLLAPLTASLSAARAARMFHPDGVVYSATVTECAEEEALRPLARRLRGTAWVRFSSALWRAPHEWPDVLGAAVRFCAEGESPEREQDVLFATIRFPWTMPFAPFATDFRSFLWNHYHAVSPFALAEAGAVKLRLRSPRTHNRSGLARARHLQIEARAGRAVLELQARRLDAPVTSRRWLGVARLELGQPIAVDQASLRFSPFRAGGGLLPFGFVHALRAGAYAASQAARPYSEAATPR